MTQFLEKILVWRILSLQRDEAVNAVEKLTRQDKEGWNYPEENQKRREFQRD